MHEFILFFPPLIKYIKSVIVGISWNYAEECDQMKIFVKVGCIFRNFKVFCFLAILKVSVFFHGLKFILNLN
jgi:hypothetical protein